MHNEHTVHHVGGVLGFLYSQVVEAPAGVSSDALVCCALHQGHPCMDPCRQSNLLLGAISNPMALLATTEASEGRTVCGGWCSCLLRANTWGGAVVISDVGTTSMARCRCGVGVRN